MYVCVHSENWINHWTPYTCIVQLWQLVETKRFSQIYYSPATQSVNIWELGYIKLPSIQGKSGRITERNSFWKVRKSQFLSRPVLMLCGLSSCHASPFVHLSVCLYKCNVVLICHMSASGQTIPRGIMCMVVIKIHISTTVRPCIMGQGQRSKASLKVMILAGGLPSTSSCYIFVVRWT